MKKKPSPLQSDTSQDLNEEVITSPRPASKKTNGKAKHEKTNGKAKHAVPVSDNFSDELDSRELLKILSEVKLGNFSVRMPVDKIGLSGKICDTLNEIISLNENLVQELNTGKSYDR